MSSVHKVSTETGATLPDAASGSTKSGTVTNVQLPMMLGNQVLSRLCTKDGKLIGGVRRDGEGK
jgi:hypothetical protein